MYHEIFYRIEKALGDAVASYDPATFGHEILAALLMPKASLASLAAGRGAASQGGVADDKMAFRIAPRGEVERIADELEGKNAKGRLLFVTDGETYACRVPKTGERHLRPLVELPVNCEPLLSLTRYEGKVVAGGFGNLKATYVVEELHKALVAARGDAPCDDAARRDTYLFLARTIFCLFADGVGLFPDKAFGKTFTLAVGPDGRDARTFLSDLFAVLDAPEGSPVRTAAPARLRAFPYVNGGLFSERGAIPEFDRKARSLLARAVAIDWSDIHPHIFGSMVQGVVDEARRAKLGMHYTSEANIRKVLGPAFLEALEKELDAALGDGDALASFLDRVRAIRVIDPACGSGNFLVVCYRELRALEMHAVAGMIELGAPVEPKTGIRISSFAGIETDRFAWETARLSMWIAQQQANRAFRTAVPAAVDDDLPLKDAPNVTFGNALRVDWESIFPEEDGTTVHVVGNPPYLNDRKSKDVFKADMKFVFGAYGGATFGNLDFVAAWIVKSAEYVAARGGTALLVTTASVCRGSQVAGLWPVVARAGAERWYAHKSFKWKNEAAKGAAVDCVIVGLRRLGDPGPKFIHDGTRVAEVDNVSPYLENEPDTIIKERFKPLGALPRIMGGFQAIDGGHLYFDTVERDRLLEANPEAARFLKRVYGSDELLHSGRRWALFIPEEDLDAAKAVPGIAERLTKVEKFRVTLDKKESAELAAFPHRFGHPCRAHERHVVAVPQLSAEAYAYLPVALVDADAAITSLASGVVDAHMSVFAVAQSSMMKAWTLAAGGAMKSDPRFGNRTVWNTFPMPLLDDVRRERLADAAWKIVEVRERYPAMTLAELYRKGSIPPDLAQAHAELDADVDAALSPRPFVDDKDRRRFLMESYEAMAAAA